VLHPRTSKSDARRPRRDLAVDWALLEEIGVDDRVKTYPDDDHAYSGTRRDPVPSQRSALGEISPTILGAACRTAARSSSLLLTELVPHLPLPAVEVRRRAVVPPAVLQHLDARCRRRLTLRAKARWSTMGTTPRRARSSCPWNACAGRTGQAAPHRGAQGGDRQGAQDPRGQGRRRGAQDPRGQGRRARDPAPRCPAKPRSAEEIAKLNEELAQDGERLARDPDRKTAEIRDRSP
jgi:hypothetical protein